MKFIFSILLGFVFSINTLFAQATLDSSQEQPDIFEVLAKKQGEEEGAVAIHQDSRMDVLFDKKMEANEGKKYIFISGYRIQAYMGNNQKRSKAEAFEREKQIKEKFPDISTYVTFTSPFWRLRVGDFRTHTDALVLAKNLKTEFPEISSEISIVRDDEVRDQELEK